MTIVHWLGDYMNTIGLCASASSATFTDANTIEFFKKYNMPELNVHHTTLIPIKYKRRVIDAFLKALTTVVSSNKIEHVKIKVTTSVITKIFDFANRCLNYALAPAILHRGCLKSPIQWGKYVETALINYDRSLMDYKGFKFFRAS